MVTTDGEQTNITYVDPSYSKPEHTPSPPPKIDEEQLSKPNKPEYKPDDVKPPVPTKPTAPKDGTKNDKGEIYIGGFGWVKDNGSGIDVEIIANSGGEDSERVGH